MLDFGNGDTIKRMIVAKWDVAANIIDAKTLVPKY
jgi:hypothetical protein